MPVVLSQYWSPKWLRLCRRLAAFTGMLVLTQMYPLTRNVGEHAGSATAFADMGSGPASVDVTDSACPVRWTQLEGLDGDPDVEVFVQRWMFALTWVDSAYGNVSVSGRLLIEPGEVLRVRFHSVDSSHGFAISQCGIELQLDAAEGEGPPAAIDILLEGVTPGEVRSQCLTDCGSDPDSFALIVSVGSETTRGDEARAQYLPPEGMTTAQWGAQIASQVGCVACHTINGAPSVGPSLLGVAGSMRELADGRSVLADRDYLLRSFLSPSSELVAGYPNVAPTYEGHLNSAQEQALADWLRSL